MATYIFPNIPVDFKANDQILFTYTSTVQTLDLTTTFIGKCRIECWGGWGTGSLSYGQHSDYVRGEYDLSKSVNKKLYFVVGRAAKGAVKLREQGWGSWWQYLPHRVDNSDYKNIKVEKSMTTWGGTDTDQVYALSDKEAECFGGGGGRSGGSSFVMTVYDPSADSPGGRSKMVDRGTLATASLNSIIICSKGCQNPKHAPDSMVGNTAPNKSLTASNTAIIRGGQPFYQHEMCANGLIALTILEDTFTQSSHFVKYKIGDTTTSVPLYASNNFPVPNGSIICNISGVKHFAFVTDVLDNSSATKLNARSDKRRKSIIFAPTLSNNSGIVTNMSDSTPCPTGEIECMERDVNCIPEGVEVVKITYMDEDNNRRGTSWTLAVLPGSIVQNYCWTYDNPRYDWDHGNSRMINMSGIATGRWGDHGFWRKIYMAYSPEINKTKTTDFIRPIWGIDRVPLMKMTGTNSGIMDTNLRASMWEPEQGKTLSIKVKFGTNQWTYNTNQTTTYRFMRAYAAGYSHFLVYNSIGECCQDSVLEGNISATFTW